jgi:hypothetical protein
VLLAAVFAVGCGGGSSAFQCANDSDCNLMAGGICEPNSYCAYPASDCASGYKYSGSSGNLSNQCAPGKADMGTRSDHATADMGQGDVATPDVARPDMSADAMGTTHDATPAGDGPVTAFALGARGHGWSIAGGKTTSARFTVYSVLGQGTVVGPKQSSTTYKHSPGILGGTP